MARRYGRTVVSETTARNVSYDARMIGADHADYAGNCENPSMVPIVGVRDRALDALSSFANSNQDYASVSGIIYHNGIGRPAAPVRHADIAVRCRKCGPCRKARAKHWQLRAQSEIEDASRTWFGTLTLKPEQQFRLVCLASASLMAGGTNYDGLSNDDQFKERVKPLVREIQLYFKRLRKAGCQFRYMIAVERHKSGAPHVHLLVHETHEPVRHKTLSAQWRLGFSKFNLVAEGEGPQAARYVSKYLTKSLSRMLVSAAYGKNQDKKCHPCRDTTSLRGAF